MGSAELLVHPLRHRVLLAYDGPPASPSDVARRLGERLNLVSYHTGVLARHGWIELVRTERRRGGTAHLYRATAAGFIENDEWENLPMQRRRGLTRGLLGIAADGARRAAAAGGFDAADAHVSRWPIQLDAEGNAAVTDLLRHVIDELARIQAESTARADAAESRAVEVVLMGFAPGRGASP
jgi:DNA-binding transcriptional ArsR family regulator